MIADRLRRPCLAALLAAMAGTAFAQTGADDASGTASAMNNNPTAVLHTSMGDITLELFADKSPRSVANFLQYAEDGHYDGTVFHRVIPHFMIQGGGFTPDLQQKPTRDPIENEAGNGLENERGTVAMARTPEPHSATSQFFINVENNDALDYQSTANSRTWGYAVFAEVTQGMDVVDEIRYVETGRQGMHQNVPLEPVVIESVEIVGR